MKNYLRKLFIGIKIGKPAEENVLEFKRYIGHASVKIIALNPNKAWIKEHTGRELQEEPVYTGVNEQGKKTLRLEFYTQTDPEYTGGIDLIQPITFFLSEAPQITRDNLKVRIIDNYGETAWVTKEEYQAGNTPATSRVQGKYKVCHQDEDKLMTFLKQWLNVSDSTRWDNEKRVWKPVDNIADTECSINFDKLVKGDVSELQQYVKECADYRVKVCFGIRTVENKHYMTICNQVFLKNSSRNFQKFEKEITRLKANGAYSTTEFDIQPLHEWTLTPTTFINSTTTAPSTDSIFGDIPTTTVVEEIPVTMTTTENNNDLPF